MDPASHHHRAAAEVIAWPFGAEPAFRAATVTLGRDAAGVPDKSTGRLWTSLEDWLRPRASGTTLDALRQQRNQLWLSHPARSASLAEVLATTACQWLSADGTTVCLHRDSDLHARAECWRWITLALPSDLLVAALAAADRRDPATEHVTLVTPQLRQVLDEGCAEGHLHVGAALSFGCLWGLLARGLLEALPDEKKLARGGRVPFDSAKVFIGHLLAAQITRLVLAGFLQGREEGTIRGTLDEYLRRFLPRLDATLRRFQGEGARSLFSSVLNSLLLGQDQRHPNAVLRRFYISLSHRPGPRSKVRDPLEAWLPPTESVSPETRFASRAIGYLLRDGRDDTTFAQLFWQYTRVRSLTFRFLVQEPGTGGLDWFTQRYDRLAPLRDLATFDYYAEALMSQSRDLNLRALEMRTTPANRWFKVRNEVRALARQAHDFEPLIGRVRPEVGLIFHFVKRWERTQGGKQRMQGDPDNAAFGYRFGPWFRDQWQRVQAIETALRLRPELLILLRSVDVCNVELAVPTWVTVPLFDQLRRASSEVARVLARRQPRWKPELFRTSVHAGEDWRRAMEGLRRVHELVEFHVLHTGDRIGHALVLGVDVARHTQAAPLVMQPAEERLDDLLWELDRYGTGDLSGDAGRVEYVRAEATRLAKAIYDEERSLAEHGEARRLRHDPRVLRRLGYPVRRTSDGLKGAELLLWRYLREGEVFARGQDVVEVVSTEAETAVAGRLQAWLRRKLGQLEITVEANPSCNLLLGNLDSLEHHPAFRLQPLPEAVGGATAAVGPDVLLSINTDNPATFASCLSDEYAHIFHALSRRDLSARQALAWLDEARRNGMRARFTLAASADREALRELLPPPWSTASRPSTGGRKA